MPVKIVWRRVPLAVLCAAAVLAFAASCDFDFLNGNDTEEAAYHYVYTKDDAGRVIATYCYDSDDALLWYELYEYDGTTSNKTIAQRFLADGTPQYSYLWRWSDGQMTVEAYFDGTSTLRWYDHYTYEGELLVELCEYDGEGALEWFEVYEYSASDKQTLAARFDGASALVGATVSEYDAEDLLILEKSYDANGMLCAKITHEWDAGGRETLRISYEVPAGSARAALPASRRAGAARGARSAWAARGELALPEPPDPPAAPALSFTEQELEVASRRFWFYDAYGSTDVTTTADYLPTAILREDTRLDEEVSVALGYDETGRIASKTTSYGSTEALAIALTYRDASGYYVSRIRTSGAAMLVPLNFDLSYDDAGLPTEVVIGYEESTLFTLTYTYDETDLLRHTISVREGDGSLYGCYVFSLASDYSSGRIDVYTDEECKDSTGYYELTYDEGSRTVSFSSYDADGTPVLSYEYGYEDLEGLGEQAFMVAESKFGFEADGGAYDAVMEQVEASDFDFTALLRIRSAKDVAELFL